MKNKNNIYNRRSDFLAIIAIYSLKSPQGASNGVNAIGVQKTVSDESTGESDEIVKILSMLSKVDLKTIFLKTGFF